MEEWSRFCSAKRRKKIRNKENKQEGKPKSNKIRYGEEEEEENKNGHNKKEGKEGVCEFLLLLLLLLLLKQETNLFNRKGKGLLKEPISNSPVF
jgi:hypothetical protein